MSVDLDQETARSELLRLIKDAREQARQIERRAENEGKEPIESLPHWRTVRDKARKALNEQAKDLEIAAYLIEASVPTGGFSALHESLQWTRELVEQAWDELQPFPDEESGISARVLPLARLNGEEGDGFLIAPLLRVPITEGKTAGPYSSLHQQQVNDFGRYSDRDREDRAKRGEVTPERFKQAVSETGADFFRRLLTDIIACQTEFAALCQALDEKCGRDDSGHSLGPPASAIRVALEQCLQGVRSIVKDRFPEDAALNDVPGQESGPTAGQGSSPAGPLPGQPKNREEAFRLLSAAADFFERTEPQSLLPAQIRKVVRLGRLPPAQYYEKLLEDPRVIEQLFKLVGIESPPSGSSD